MKIAYLTSVYGRASDTFVRNEVVELRRRGHTVQTFSIRRHAADAEVDEAVRREQATTDYILERGPWRLAAALLGLAATRPAALLAAARLAWRTRARGLRGTLLQAAYLLEAAYLARALRAARIEVLHNHIAENSANVAMLASRLSGVPFGMTVHGPGIFFHPRHWALGEKIARAAYTVTITDFCRSQCMLFSDAADWPKLHVVRCSVGPDFHAPADVQLPSVPRFAFIGRLAGEKGLDVLVEAVSRLVAEGVAIEVALIGDGPLRGHVERVVSGRGLQRAITLLGWRSSEGVRRELEASRGLVLPSFAEGLPVVIMEALALGRPVIATQIAGIPELVTDRGNGWLVPAGSVEALAAALREAATAAPEQLQAMGRRGAEAVGRLHDFAREIDKLERLLRRHARAAA